MARLFRRFHGMEYCDLKKDRVTGKSKVRPRGWLGPGAGGRPIAQPPSGLRRGKGGEGDEEPCHADAPCPVLP